MWPRQERPGWPGKSSPSGLITKRRLLLKWRRRRESNPNEAITITIEGARLSQILAVFTVPVSLVACALVSTAIRLSEPQSGRDRGDAHRPHLRRTHTLTHTSHHRSCIYVDDVGGPLV